MGFVYPLDLWNLRKISQVDRWLCRGYDFRMDFRTDFRMDFRINDGFVDGKSLMDPMNLW